MTVDSSNVQSNKPVGQPNKSAGPSSPKPGNSRSSSSQARKSSAAKKSVAVKVQQKAEPAEQEDAGEDTEKGEGLLQRRTFLLFTAMPSWLTSMVIHIIMLLILALLSVPPPPPEVSNELTLGDTEETTNELEEFVEQQIEPLDVEALTTDELVTEVETELLTEEPIITPADELEAAPSQMQFDPLGRDAAAQNDLLTKVGTMTGSGLEGRGAVARAAMVREAGGTEGSEKAVAAALKWFAAHQNENGSWNLDHRFGPCQSRCRNHGPRQDAVNGATALALLPFLGAGQTHQEGDYQKTVGAGLDFLLRNMRVVGRRGSLVDEGGNYYSHGIGAIVLCEAYAMTRDKRLMRPAQMAIYETAFAQDPVGGGWRYNSRQRGDTSALGWQLMALKSAHMAYLDVPPETYKGAAKFLDSVQAESGAKYGYLDPGTSSGTTAVGLLCRMYLGWKRDNPALERGVEFLSSRGPSRGNMYYNYYATQIMRHYGGDAWKVWNARMRDYLVNAQAQTGHEKGSWFFRGGGHAGAVGGRLYATSMATMILEVYYRHMPIYQQQASEEDFPL